jgi:hypothetical protein
LAARALLHGRTRWSMRLCLRLDGVARTRHQRAAAGAASERSSKGSVEEYRPPLLGGGRFDPRHQVLDLDVALCVTGARNLLRRTSLLVAHRDIGRPSAFRPLLPWDVGATARLTQRRPSCCAASRAGVGQHHDVMRLDSAVPSHTTACPISAAIEVSACSVWCPRNVMRRRRDGSGTLQT